MKNRPYAFLFIFTVCVFTLFFYLESEKSQNLVTREKEAIPFPIKKLNTYKPKQRKIIKSFLIKKEELLKTIPLKRDFQQSENLHQAPDALVQKAKELAQLKEMVARYKEIPEIQNEALDFYQECADHVDYPTSIRSLCLFNRLTLAKTLGKSVDISEYPLEMKRLVLQLKPF